MGLDAISCPATTLCVALDAAGRLVVSSHPTRGRVAWRQVTLTLGSVITALDCPTVRRCFATDDTGDLWTTTKPLGAARGWTRTGVDVNSRSGYGVPLTGVACVRAKLCVVGDSAGDALQSTRPTQGSRAWRTSILHAGNKDGAFWSVSCPSLSLCVLSDGYRLWASTDPSAGRWGPEVGSAYGDPGEGYELEGSTCATAHLCFAYGNDGSVDTSANPAGGPGAWKQSRIDTAPSGYVDGIACKPHSRVCVAVDDLGRIITTG